MRTRTTAGLDLGVKTEKARSRNDLLARAPERKLKLTRRQAIDEAFAGMASDLAFQQEAHEISEGFAAADWSALPPSLSSPRR